MRILLAAVLMSAAVGAGAQAPQKGVRLERRSDCTNAAAFEMLVSAGGDGWGIPEEDAQASVELLAATFQCRAFVARSEKTCDGLGYIPRFPAAKLLAKGCRSEHALLTFYEAMNRRAAGEAEAACARWYDVNGSEFYKQLKGADVCKRAVALLLAEPGSACEKLGEDLASQVRDSRERRGIVGMCRAVWTPSRKTCAEAEGMPMERSTCEAYGGITLALASKNLKDCPKSERYGGLCRALLAKEPREGCEVLRASWQKLLCDNRFQAGQGED